MSESSNSSNSSNNLTGQEWECLERLVSSKEWPILVKYLLTLGKSNELSNAIRDISASESKIRAAQGWLGCIEHINGLTPGYCKAERSKYLQSSREGASVGVEQNQ